MKLIAIFMTWLMLSSGFDFCSYLNTCETAGVENATTDVKTGLCSPFCQCTQCPASFLIPKPLMETAAIYAASSVFIYPLTGIPTRIDSTIWEPPKSS